MENQLQQKDIDFLKQSVDALAKSMKEGFVSVNGKLDFMTEHYIKREELDRELVQLKEKVIREASQLKEEIASLRANQTWVVRTVVGIIISALIGLVVVNK